MPLITRREMVLGSVCAGAAATAAPGFTATASAAPGAIPLYPGSIPNAIQAPDEEATRDPSEQWVYRQNVSRPTLNVFLPGDSQATGAAVVICPGGSYRGVSIDKEGYNVARAFNQFGVAAIVLKYRTPSARHMREPHLGPLQDAQQALHAVHHRAHEWRIDTKRIGIVGFSAGGHLAASASTLFAAPVLEHAVAQVRPAFSILIYPVISMRDGVTHAVSREQLLGAAPEERMIARFSADEAVTESTPPVFLVHAADDAGVPVANSIRYFEACKLQGVSAQLFVYARGGHGYGLNNPTTNDRWIDSVQRWMVSESWLQPRGAAA